MAMRHFDLLKGSQKTGFCGENEKKMQIFAKNFGDSKEGAIFAARK
jgi:hypothetical protein